MICMDALDKEIRDKYPIKDIDILCVISFQKTPYDHHQVIDQIVKSCHNIYVAYANCYCPSLSGGRSSFFSKNFEDKSKQSHKMGLSKQDGITWRAIEMPDKAGCLIVECNLENKNIVNIADTSESRSLISIHGIYFFENESLARYEPITTHHKKDDNLPDAENNETDVKNWKEDTISKIYKIASTWKYSRMSHKEWLRQYRYIQKNNKNQSIPMEYKNIYKDYEYVLRKDYISGDCQGRNNNYLIESLKDYSETIDIYLECTNYIEYAAIIYSIFNIKELLDSWNERARYSVNLKR